MSSRSNGNGAHMVQRGAANLRMNVPVAALTIIDVPGRLHNVLSDQRILSGANFLQSSGMLDQTRFQQSLTTITPAIPAAAAVDSGYSSAAIRERVYLPNDATRGIRGGDKSASEADVCGTGTWTKKRYP